MCRGIAYKPLASSFCGTNSSTFRSCVIAEGWGVEARPLQDGRAKTGPSNHQPSTDPRGDNWIMAEARKKTSPRAQSVEGRSKLGAKGPFHYCPGCDFRTRNLVRMELHVRTHGSVYLDRKWKELNKDQESHSLRPYPPRP
jgi:hypothetical protein